eukprot:14753-Heterococcus_DN1.PRE.2
MHYTAPHQPPVLAGAHLHVQPLHNRCIIIKSIVNKCKRPLYTLRYYGTRRGVQDAVVTSSACVNTYGQHRGMTNANKNPVYECIFYTAIPLIPLHTEVVKVHTHALQIACSINTAHQHSNNTQHLIRELLQCCCMHGAALQCQSVHVLRVIFCCQQVALPCGNVQCLSYGSIRWLNRNL